MAKKNYCLMCQRRFCKLVWIIEKALVCLEGYLRLEMSLKTLLTIIENGAKKATLIQNHMQNPQSVICHLPICRLVTRESPDLNRRSGLLDNAEPSLQISVHLSGLGSISVMSKLTSQN